jgi:hypothetical protein
MHNKRSLRPILARGGLTAAVALLAGLSQAYAQAPAPGAPLSGAGSFPQSFIVPGTNTSLHVGGFIQMDVTYDMSAFGNASSPGALDNLAPESVELTGNGIPGNPAGHTDHGVWRWTAQNSRPYIETRTPTAYGELKTYVEFDFAGSNSVSGGNGTATATSGALQTNFNQQSMMRLRQAYGTLGPWLFGQTNSNFMDLAALPDTLDAFVEAGGFMGVGTVRQPQVRYTYLLPNGMTATASVEANASAGEIATKGTGAGAVTFNDFNAPGFAEKWPAVTTGIAVQQPWGHAAFHIAVAENRFKQLGLTAGLPPAAVFGGIPALGTGGHIAKWGYQLNQSGHFNTIGNDKITWLLQYGQGAGQYTWALNELGTQWVEDLVCSATATGVNFYCSQPRVMGANAGYSHFWTDEWRSGVSFGYDQVSRPNAAGDWGQVGLSGSAANALATLERKHYSAALNVLWTPVRGAQFGIEYEWYHRTVWSGAHGSSNRIKAQSLFSF